MKSSQQISKMLSHYDQIILIIKGGRQFLRTPCRYLILMSDISGFLVLLVIPVIVCENQSIIELKKTVAALQDIKNYLYVAILRLVPQIDPSVPQSVFTITEKAPTSAFTFKTLLRHYAKRALTPR